MPLLIALALPVGVSASSAAPSQAPSPAPPLPAAVAQAPVVLLVDLSAGQTLYARNAERRLLPASMTKVMSALIAFDLIAAGKLDENAQVVVRPETAARWAGEGTSLYLKPGQRLQVRDLLLGLTAVSANDAAVTLAETALGSTAAWTAAMNQRAKALHMTGSHFATPNGWPDGGRTYVTARDMVRLANALIMQHPQAYRRYFGQQGMDWQGQHYANRDPLTGVVPGADGIKTGHTREAGFNFIGAVERGGRRLVLVVGGVPTDPARAAAARTLAEWGYAAWDSRPLVRAGQVVAQARVQGGAARTVPLALPRAFRLTVPKGTRPSVSTRVIYDGPVRAPIARGALLGGLEVRIDGQPVHYLPLVAARAVGPAGPFDRLANGLLGLLE